MSTMLHCPTQLNSIAVDPESTITQDSLVLAYKAYLATGYDMIVLVIPHM